MAKHKPTDYPDDYPEAALDGVRCTCGADCDCAVDRDDEDYTLFICPDCGNRWRIGRD